MHETLHLLAIRRMISPLCLLQHVRVHRVSRDDLPSSYRRHLKSAVAHHLAQHQNLVN